MKVGIYATYLGRENNTGVEVYAEELIKRLVKNRNYEFFLLGAHTEEISSENVKHFQLKSGLKLFPLYGEVKKFINKYDLDAFFFPCQYTYFSRKQTSLVTAFDVAWKYFPEYFPQSKRLAFDFLTSYSVKKSSRILAISEATKKDLVDLYNCDPDKVKVAKLGYDKSKYYPNINENDILLLTEKGLQPDEYLLFLGTIQKRKNIINLIRAYDNAITDMPLVLAGGKGWFFEEIKEVIKSSKKKEKIIMLGYINENEKGPLYRGCKMFLYPSLYEGFGLPVLEAMACGSVVLTSNVSSLPEVIGDAGISVDPYDVSQMTDYINKGVDGEFDYLKNKAIDRSLKFSWENTSLIAMDLLRECFEL